MGRLDQRGVRIVPVVAIEVEQDGQIPVRREPENGAVVVVTAVSRGAVQVAIGRGEKGGVRGGGIVPAAAEIVGNGVPGAIGSEPENRTTVVISAGGGGAVKVAVRSEDQPALR